ncbi:DUF6063 family protein [Anaerocolumna sp. MB42-C2]|uniref:DUF6063 family protein n=1 Tax=Anaerocolumna sp. MB42-C2 TaxID=3070997 RepID=UPI0027E1D865|nr:DUF6063 family protein [Anaerocolumna sp. MB42-C2]WMJ89755.1 DUF6063 family protein [Anaerocolumna sp. MB42-C2]
MIKSALKIYSRLLKEGQFSSESDSELFLEYKKEEVRELLSELEEELGFELLEVGQTIYMIPNLENDVLSMSMKELRESISSNSTLTDAYLQTYIIMIILYLFYGGKNNNPVQRDFLQIKVLIDELDKRFDGYLNQSDQLDSYEEEYGVNFGKIAEYWSNKQVYDEGKLKTKAGTVMKALKLLEREKLIRLVEDNREIRPTKRLHDIFVNYYLHEDRVQEIQRIFDKEV